MIFLIIFLAILLVPVLLIITVYNRLQRQKVDTEQSWSNIGAAIQQRNDLVPNLVATVKGYAKHENETLNEVTRWRNQSASATTALQQNDVQAGMSKALANVLAVAENYPDLKADAGFRELQSELRMLEQRINGARDQYNASVRDFNASLAVFPNNLVAGFFSMQPATFFREDKAAREVPKVDFN
jgi:LemA protein